MNGSIQYVVLYRPVFHYTAKEVHLAVSRNFETSADLMRRVSSDFVAEEGFIKAVVVGMGSCDDGERSKFTGDLKGWKKPCGSTLRGSAGESVGSSAMAHENASKGALQGRLTIRIRVCGLCVYEHRCTHLYEGECKRKVREGV